MCRLVIPDFKAGLNKITTQAPCVGDRIRFSMRLIFVGVFSNVFLYSLLKYWLSSKPTAAATSLTW